MPLTRRSLLSSNPFTRGGWLHTMFTRAPRPASPPPAATAQLPLCTSALLFCGCVGGCRPRETDNTERFVRAHLMSELELEAQYDRGPWHYEGPEVRAIIDLHGNVSYERVR